MQRRLKALQRRGNIRAQLQPRRRQPRTAPSALEKPLAEPSLELGDLVADRGLRQPQPFSRPPEAAGFGDGAEGLQGR